MPKYSSDSDWYWIIGAVVVICGIALLVWGIQFMIGFSQELRYLNNEIGRSHGEERRRWLRRRRKLWLSLIPFVKY